MRGWTVDYGQEQGSLWYVQMFTLWSGMSVICSNVQSVVCYVGERFTAVSRKVVVKTYAPIPNSIIGNASYC